MNLTRKTLMQRAGLNEGLEGTLSYWNGKWKVSYTTDSGDVRGDQAPDLDPSQVAYANKMKASIMANRGMDVDFELRNGKAFLTDMPKLNEGPNDVDYEKLVDLIAGADNDRNLKISYDSYHNGIKFGNIGGGVTYDRGDLVKKFKQPVGSSSDIMDLFREASKDPETTKREVERIATEKFGSKYKLFVSTEEAFGPETIVYYNPRF